MAKRVVKETDSYGRTYYVVETNRILGFIPCKWRLCNTKSIHTNLKNKAFFNKLSYATNFINYGEPTLCKEEVIKEFKDK